MHELMDALGYQFQDPALLQRALTHPSVGEKNNQRLEFLGDAVLEYIMSEILYETYPDAQEGELTRLRALLVCEKTQSQIATKLKLGDWLRMDRGELLTGGRTKPSVLCDTLQAVLAAVYLDGGLQPVRSIIHSIWPKAEDVHHPVKDNKSALQELLQRNGGATPVYRTIDTFGPPHKPTFVAAVYQDDRELARGEGTSKKQAELAAAAEALRKLGVQV